MLQDNNAFYVYGPGGIVLETIQGTSPGTPYYYHIDQLGSVRAVTNSSGTTVDSYTYDAYGKATSSSVTVAQPFGYAGEFTDSESGYLYIVYPKNWTTKRLDLR